MSTSHKYTHDYSTLMLVLEGYQGTSPTHTTKKTKKDKPKCAHGCNTRLIGKCGRCKTCCLEDKENPGCFRIDEEVYECPTHFTYLPTPIGHCDVSAICPVEGTRMSVAYDMSCGHIISRVAYRKIVSSETNDYTNARECPVCNKVFKWAKRNVELTNSLKIYPAVNRFCKGVLGDYDPFE